MRRMFINQPSTHQPLHKFHGVKVLAEDKPVLSSVRVYFLDGPLISMLVMESYLSQGWPEDKVSKPRSNELFVLLDTYEGSGAILEIYDDLSKLAQHPYLTSKGIKVGYEYGGSGVPILYHSENGSLTEESQYEIQVYKLNGGME